MFGPRKLLFHFILFKLVAAVHDQALRLVPIQHSPNKMFAERPGAAGDENAFIVQHAPVPFPFNEEIFPRYRTPGENPPERSNLY